MEDESEGELPSLECQSMSCFHSLYIPIPPPLPPFPRTGSTAQKAKRAFFGQAGLAARVTSCGAGGTKISRSVASMNWN